MKVKLTEMNVTRMLSDSFDESSDAGLAFYFFRWSRRCNGARHGLRAVCMMIHIAVACSTLVDCFCRMLNTEKAIDMSKETMAAGLEPDVKIYNTLVRVFCRERKCNEACEILISMTENGVPPTRVTHLALVHALYVRGEADVLEKAATDLREINLKSGIVVGESQLVDPDS